MKVNTNDERADTVCQLNAITKGISKNKFFSLRLNRLYMLSRSQLKNHV